MLLCNNNNNNNDNDDCSGWIAAMIAAIAYGSYGVPIKATMDLDVHPFVLQSYKTIVLFFSSWIYYYFMNQQNQQQQETTTISFQFTPSYGLVSGMLWVIGGTCGVYGIRNAGMAVAVGTWASVMVGINFSWGIVIFQEPIHSFRESCIAFLLLLIGLIGMSHYSAPTTTTTTTKQKPTTPTTTTTTRTKSLLQRSQSLENSNASNHHHQQHQHLVNRRETANEVILEENDNNNNNSGGGGEQDSVVPMLPLRRASSQNSLNDNDDDDHKKRNASGGSSSSSIFIVVVLGGGMKLTSRQSGIIMAAMNGILAGSSLIPLHYAKQQHDDFQNSSYILSFGIGSLLANILLWCLYLSYYYLKTTSTNSNATTSTSIIPSFYFGQLWKRGAMAGILLSIGMFGSIIATSSLGQGVGNSLVQSKIIISGLWGIGYYKEITNRKNIRLWFLSAILCVSGILLLSYERLMVITVNEDEQEDEDLTILLAKGGGGGTTTTTTPSIAIADATATTAGIQHDQLSTLTPEGT